MKARTEWIREGLELALKEINLVQTYTPYYRLETMGKDNSGKWIFYPELRKVIEQKIRGLKK